jgi:hypothetical protein
MRRLLSILLLAAFVLPTIAPLLAFAQAPDAGLPVCCRRHGRHHCTMLDTTRAPSAHRIVAVCPLWPQRALAPSAISHTFTAPAASPALALRTTLTSRTHSIAHRRTARDRSHSQRGPPAPSLA